MRLRTASLLTAAGLAALYLYAPDRAEAQRLAGVSVRVDALKKLTLVQKERLDTASGVDRESSFGPVLLGPQPAIELEWDVLNTTGATLEVPSPERFLRLRVVRQGREIPVRTTWAAAMTVKDENERLTYTTVPLGASTVPDRSTLRVRGSTTSLDGSAFSPADYLLKLDGRDLHQVSTGGVRTVLPVDRGLPVKLRIIAVDSRERQRQFHMIEGSFFYRRRDAGRALEHYAVLAWLPGAPSTDSLPLAYLYGDLGRHHEANAVFRRILPDLIRAHKGPARWLRDGPGHPRRAAMSLAAVGDVAGAANVLRLEGDTPEAEIAGVVERLRQTAERLRQRAPKGGVR